jgi:hypothetical protein
MPERRHRYKLEQTGDIGTHQRALDKIGLDLDALELRTGPYTPADATDWAGTPPTTISEALDRLAARIATSGTGA